jgi:hypothetical protein
MTDSEPSQQEQSIGAAADTVGASGSYSNSTITMLRTGETLPTSRDEQILAAKYRARCHRDLSTSPGTPQLRTWMPKAMS